MWHLSQFSKRLELLIKPSGYGYNAYNQPILVKIPALIIPYLESENDIFFVDIDGNALCYYAKMFSPGTNEVEYYVKIKSIDDLNYTSLFVYYKYITGIINVLFEDDFESGALSVSKWTVSISARAGVSTHTANSGVYSMYTKTNGVSVTSKVINLSGMGGVNISCWVRRGSDSFSEDPDTNEDFVIEYLNSSSSWIQLDIFYGNGTAGQIYNKIYILPSSALHSGFRLRFRQTGGSGGTGDDYWHTDDVIIFLGYKSLSCVFDEAYIVNFLDTTFLESSIGPNFSNHGAALHQPVCNTYAAKVTGGTTYISCNISKTFFTLFFNCYVVSGEGYLVYFSSTDYVYLNVDGTLVVRRGGVNYDVGSRLYFNVCSTFSITYDGSNVYVVINGFTKLVIAGTISISEIRLGGNGSSGYSIECYFFDLFLLPPKLPLYSYYFHNTVYDNSNFFREVGYDNHVTNGYLTHWPEVIFSGDEAIFKPNICLFEGWGYYRPITITNSGTNPLSEQQVVVDLSTDILGNPYTNINSDGSDLRFTSVSGCLFQYCIDAWDNTGDSKIRVSVSGTDVIPVGNSTVYMYYGKESSTAATTSVDYCGYYDCFDVKNDSYWHFDTYQTVPYDLSGKNVLKMWGDDNWRGYYSKYEHIVTGMEAKVDFLGTALSDWHHAAVEHGGDLHRFAIKESSGDVVVHYRVDGGSWIYPKTLISGVKFDTWYTALFRVDDISGFYVKVWEKDDSTAYGDYSYAMPTGLTWRFRSWQYQNIDCYNDNYKVYITTQGEPFISTTVGSGIEIEGIFDVEENITQQYIKYSVSFNNGSSWYVSNLNYDDIFTKYFGSPAEYDTVLRLSTDTETINKTYIVKINDFNQFDVNYGIDFTAGSTKDGYIDTETDFMVALPTFYGTEPTPVEYAYETSMSGVKSLYFSRPVEISWGGALGSGIISKDVEYCFDVIMDSWTNDTEVEFWLGELYQGYHIDYPVDFTLSSGYTSYTNMEVDFVLANWRYFPHQADIICSEVDYNNQETEIEVGKGSLMRFLSDIKSSDEQYDDFNSSVFCSLSGIPINYQHEVQVISGSIGNYGSDVYCSLVATNNFVAEIKLNTVVIENFNIDETVVTGTNFCFNIDVYDMYYGVTTSGIQIFMNTNTITGNEVTNKTFLTISGGHTASWCYGIGALSPAEYIEVIIKGTNTYGDLNIASYFLRYGKRYHYNLYHIVKHEYGVLIPMLMAAENNVDIFPSFSTETIYIRTENYHQTNLQTSIFGVSLDRGDLQAEVFALTNNFYNGGNYKVRVECSDLSGNEMSPLEFEFTIRSDGL